MKKFKDNIKFSFSPEFQFEILRFVLKDKEGGLVLKRIKSNYLSHRTLPYLRGYIKIF